VPREIAYYLLAAEAQAWPIASRASFDEGTIALECESPGVLKRATEALAHALEEYLRPRAAGMSVEVLRQLRDHAWFAAGVGRQLDFVRVPLAQYLRWLAEEYLEPRGRTVSLRYRPSASAAAAPTDICDEAERAARWRWLSFLVPPDLLIGALYTGTRTEPPTDQVSLATPQLMHVLEHEVADTHLHLGAAFSFGQLWASLMRALADSAFDIGRVRTAPSAPFGSGDRYCRILLAAAIVRTLMAAFLWHRAFEVRPRPFVDFWTASDGGRRIAEALRWPGTPGEGFNRLSDALALLVPRDAGPKTAGLGSSTAKPGTLLANLHALYQKLIGPRPQRQGGRAGSTISDDPLADWLVSDSGRALPETRLVAIALDYLSLSPDPDFELIFWQYQRVRCQTYQYLVEAPSTAGLDWFKRHYDRLQIFRGRLDPSAVLGALQLESLDIGLGAIEVRTSPDSRWSGVRDKVRSVASQAASYQQTPSSKRPEIGIILHFLKGERCVCGRTFADPRHKAYGSRYAPWFMSRLQEAQAIATLLGFQPELLLLLRGVDVAAVELAIPTWVLVPLFDIIDGAAIAAAAQLARQEPTWHVPPLRHTLHAGEDYRRLVEGLRRIHEPIEFGLLRPGDRIGHGFALGVDPAR
jgi:type IV secretory pathway TrbD component